MSINLDPRLYLVTDRSRLEGRDFLAVVEAALRGGVTMLQLREKECSGREFYELAVALRELTRRYEVPFWINDRLDIALAVGADGLHIGQSDLPAAVAKKLLPPGMLLGVSAKSVEQALAAEEAGADCLGCGAVYPTSTKVITRTLACDELRRIKAAVSLPVVAIGGITADNLAPLMACGIDGVAVVSAIMAEADAEAAARKLLAAVDRHRQC
jgi:thiamine-phosphate pyrophosphorylase